MIVMMNKYYLTAFIGLMFTIHNSLAAGDIEAGKSVYDGVCAACHGSGIPGIPQFGDATAWSARIKLGKETLYEHAIHGFKGKSGMPMPARGGKPDLTDDEVKAAVDYLITNIQGTQAERSADTGKQQAQVCAACHGADGNSTTPAWPKLAGQHADYIIKQLKDFQEGNRINALMSPIAKSMSEEEMASWAGVFSSQKIKHGTADPAMLGLGKKIYRSGNSDAGVPACLACHGPTGRGNPSSNYPALAGQHAVYTESQLNAFRADIRSNDVNEVMRSVVDRMSDEEINAVSEYIQGLH